MHYFSGFLVFGAISIAELAVPADLECCRFLAGQCSIETNSGAPSKKTKPRRYDINDLGYGNYFHGWADVQGQGAANDFCRIVGNVPNLLLSCALAGTNGQSDNNYISSWGFEIGHPNTWYMKDEDGDGRDDYCRCLGDDPAKSQVVCTKAGENGFYGSKIQGGANNTFTPTGNIDCKSRAVHPEFGRVPGFVI